MTTQTLLAASIDRIVLGREKVKFGTVYTLLYTTAKAIEGGRIEDVKRANALIERSIADGSIELLCTDEQMEMLEWGLDQLAKFTTGECMAIKERKQLDAVALRVADFNRKVAQSAQYEF
jgi:hypothetical protein